MMSAWCKGVWRMQKVETSLVSDDKLTLSALSGWLTIGCVLQGLASQGLQLLESLALQANGNPASHMLCKLQIPAPS